MNPPPAAFPPAQPSVIGPQRAGQPDLQVFRTVEEVAAWFLRRAHGRRLQTMAQAVSADGCEEFPVVAVFAAKKGGSEEWLGWACGPQIEGPREFEKLLDRLRGASGMAA